MDTRASKLRKLNEFRRPLPHVSASALSSILSEIKKQGVPDGGTSRNALRQARDDQCSEITPYGPVLQYIKVFDKDFIEKQIAVAHPLALMWKSV